MDAVRAAPWLVSEAGARAVFSPERLDAEHQMIRQTAAQFVGREIVPAVDGLEQKDWTLARTLVKRCGELGLFGTGVPEALGGSGGDHVGSVLVSEALGAAPSFAATFGAQKNLVITPLLWFGTDDQQRRYLPRLLAGDLVGAYCLSESTSGSDALDARTRAARRPDGSWVLSGEKMWTTNGGFADLFLVFAKADGDRFTAFLVEREFDGVASGKEEHKMGLHGSSTTPVLLQNVAVPSRNVLGEIGSAHKIAFNVLNYGRLMLAATCSGGAKAAIAEAARYGLERRQFGQPIASFGAIRQKLAEMTIRQFGVESMLYRTVADLDEAGGASTGPSQARTALEHFAADASILKIAGSEMLDYVVDENVQIHGGNGYVRDYQAERRYRDARVNLIFEGTNEINRLLIPLRLLKQQGTSAADVTTAAADLCEALRAARDQQAPDMTSDIDAAARHNVGAVKKIALLMLNTAVNRFGDRLRDEQESLFLISDVIGDAFQSESAFRRSTSQANGENFRDVAAVIAYDAWIRTSAAARTMFEAVAEPAVRREVTGWLTGALGCAPIDTIAARRRIAAAVLDARGYPFA